VARALENVHAVIRITDVHDRDLVLLEPLVHLVPVEREIPGDRRRVLDRLWITPDGVLGHAIADPYRPVAGIALERTVAGVLGGLENVGSHLVLGEIEHRQMAVLVQKLGVTAVDDRLVGEPRAHAARKVLEVDDPFLSGAFEVENARRALAKGSGAYRQSHRLPPLSDEKNLTLW
jgi:hypothetical protein